MSLLTDPAFLVYQLRVSFLRTNDPAGERVLTFDDLSVPLGCTAPMAPGAPSPMTPQSRRKTSASEIRQQVAQNTAANAYIMACGHYPETDAVHSPPIEHDEGYMYSHAAPRLPYTTSAARSNEVTPSARYPDRAGAPARNKRTNRNAKIAPTGEGREEVVGLGVVPPHAEMMLGAEPIKYRPLPAVEEAVDSGSLSDGAQPLEPPPAHWQPEAMPPRRSLDTIHPPARTAAHALPRRQMGHAYSSSMATIRLQQRPTELLRKGSSRDAIALGIDFDVKSIFEGSEDAVDSDTGSKQLSSAKSSIDGRSSQERSEDAVSKLELLKQNLGEDLAQKAGPLKQKPRKKSAASIGIRSRRNETSFKIPLTNLRDERSAGSSTLLKRSATLPTKRAGASNYNANSAAHRAAAPATAANQKSRWVGGYTDEATPAPGWDDSDDDDVTPLSRRGGGTQTWYGPQANIRPISMFPATRANAPYLMPPVPLMFGADDSDDDIDLEGDEGSSRTPATLAMARGLRLYAGSPNPSVRSHKDSVTTLLDRARSHRDTVSTLADRARSLRFVLSPSALATSVPVSSPLATSVPVSSPLTTTPAPLAVSGIKYEHLVMDLGTLRPRGISDPEGRQSSRNSRIQSSANSSWRPVDADTSCSGSTDGNKQMASASGTWLADGKPGTKRPASGSEPLTPRDLSAREQTVRELTTRDLTATSGGAFGTIKDQDTAAYVPPVAPTSSGLAALLATKLVVRHNPFSEEFGAVGGTAGDGSLVELNIFIQHSDTKSAPQTIRVRRTSTVEQAIGFALYRYLEDECEPALAPDVQDVVMWALRIAMDGEVDDDFPAFDRTRPVANFVFDEFALCLASPDQIKTNEAIRVRQGRPARMARPKSLTPATPLSAPASARAPDADSKEPCGLLNTITHRVETSAVVLQPSRIATASMAGIFVGTSVLQAVEGPESRDMTSNIELLSAAEPQQLRLLRVQMLGDPSSADALRATTIEADGNATIRMVLAQVCRKKQFLEDQYVLGVFDSTGFSVCSSDMRVAQLPPASEMYLHRVGAALPTLRAPPVSDAPLYGQQQRQQIAIEDPIGALLAAQSSAIDMAAAYYTFRVIRRAQMFTRHERSLVISGETIALMPFDHDAETAKTLTFHISNVICKRNQKSPKKIRLFISRRGNTGEKSIDLEAESEEDAASICGILMRLGDHYNQTIGM
ncbi:Component of a membrane-bound complex containing the Tor2p kinase [Coemansia sp. RSA 1822]|nr:Component of a membrane-bound complex containing the Tor2p kinase [Coemansia sp. RSA 638]KAJ2125849.1 Component of a membrane-bound complex containing the Tor2p kinase [Coemansia sp. RSA 720]KAJ2542970.1 Component of a membrane-bound complex containing the Tor2p kinase [Coemansia sp. RSA 1853]KAJ2563612.1 Component of a membrane-bound complex containing the Tor2p kinase [Coemansia sp. RSA 1822]